MPFQMVCDVLHMRADVCVLHSSSTYNTHQYLSYGTHTFMLMDWHKQARCLYHDLITPEAYNHVELKHGRQAHHTKLGQVSMLSEAGQLTDLVKADHGHSAGNKTRLHTGTRRHRGAACSLLCCDGAARPRLRAWVLLRPTMLLPCHRNTCFLYSNQSPCVRMLDRPFHQIMQSGDVCAALVSEAPLLPCHPVIQLCNQRSDIAVA